MSEYMGAGQLDKRAEVLELQEIEPGVWMWEKVGMAWANITFQSKNNLFSSVGIGARNAAVVVRRRPLTLHNALRWNGQNLFLTSIVPRGKAHLDLEAAVVTPVTCRSEGVTFPAVRTEKYLGWNRDVPPMSQNEYVYVLVAPKAVPQLTPGGLVAVEGAEWEIRVAHTLDEYKSEYEIARTVEL